MSPCKIENDIIHMAVYEDKTPLCVRRQQDKTRNTAGPVSLRAFTDAKKSDGLKSKELDCIRIIQSILLDVNSILKIGIYER